MEAPITPAGPVPSIPQDLLELLVCPIGRAPLRLEGDRLVCTRCGVSYGVEGGVANLLAEEGTLPPGVADIDELPCRKQ